MSNTKELLDQLDKLVLSPILSNDLSSPILTKPLSDNQENEAEVSEEDSNYNDIYDISSIKSNTTNGTSINEMDDNHGDSRNVKSSIGLNSIALTSHNCLYSTPPENSRIHNQIRHKHINLNNILDCLEDMLVQETLQLEMELHKFSNDINNCKANNTYIVHLFQGKKRELGR